MKNIMKKYKGIIKDISLYMDRGAFRKNIRGLRKIPSFSLGPETWKNFELFYI